MRDPHRNIPMALFMGIGVLIALYIAANFAYYGVLSMSEMKAAGDHAAEEMLKKLLGQGGLAAMSAVIMCSTFGAINTNLLYRFSLEMAQLASQNTLNSWPSAMLAERYFKLECVLQAPRITFAMGRDNVFFRSLGSVHATFRTPAMAIAVMAVMSISLVLAVAVAKHLVTGTNAGSVATMNYSDADTEQQLLPRVIASLRNDSIFGLLTNFVIFSASIFYMLGVLAVIVLRFRRPEGQRPYKTWGYPIVPTLFLVVYVWFMAQVYQSNPLESRTGLVFIASGMPVFFAYQYRARRLTLP